MNARMSPEEARENKLCLLINARTHAIERDILTGRVSTTEAVLERMTIDGDEDEVRVILWTAVVGGACAVGAHSMSGVEAAIYFEAEALAEKDVADMERRRIDEARFDRIERRVYDHFFAREAV
jgi:hypothetical protein